MDGVVLRGIYGSFFFGRKSESEDTAAVPKQEKKNTAAAEEENEEKSMGRYLEREMALPEEISEMVQNPVLYIKKLESGDLMLAEKEAGKYISSDGGENPVESRELSGSNIRRAI